MAYKSIGDFAKEVKTKYPAYKDWDDTHLAAQMVEKYPQAYSGWFSKEDKVTLHKTALKTSRDTYAKNFQAVPEAEGYQNTSGFGGILKAGANKLNTAIQAQEEGKQTRAETAFQSVGTAIGTGGDLVFEAIKKVTPAAVKKPAAAAVKKVAESPVVQPVLQTVSDVAAKNPRVARNVDAAINVASVLPAVKGAEATTKAVTGVVDKVRDARAVTKTWETVKPELSALKQAEAVKAGSIKPKGVLGTVTQVPKAREVTMIDVAKPYVNKAKNEFEAVANMKQGIKESAEKVRAGLKDSKAIWNENELKGRINGIEKPITVKSDTTLNNQFENLKKATLKLAAEAEKKPQGILDLRQRFDDLVEKEFGSAIYQKDNPIGRVVREYRKAMNDFAESKLPDGKLPDGSSFKDELRRQSLLYDAIDNTAAKAPKVGSNVISQFAKANPKIAKAAKYTAAAGAGAVGVNIFR